MNNQNPGIFPELVFSAGTMTDETTYLSLMVRLALKSGIYLFEASPAVVCCLKEYPGHPHHLLSSISLLDVRNGQQLREAVEKQLRSIGRSHIEWLCLDDVCEGTLLNKEWDWADILSALRELTRRGVVDRLGFGFAGMEQTLRDFLDERGEIFSFCVLQLNYMDWFLKKAQGCVMTLQKTGMTIIGRNPLRDGKLLSIAPEYAADLVSDKRQNDSPLEWAYRWLQTGPKADYVICVPESLEQLQKIIEILRKPDPLTPNEEATAYYVAGRIRKIEESLHCSGCLRCEGNCPAGLDVRYLMQLLVDMQVENTPSLVRQYLALPKEKRASACTQCGLCLGFCQKISNIPLHMQELSQLAGEL